MTPRQLKLLREEGGLKLTVYLTIDAESVYKSVTSRDLRNPAEKTLLGHILWLRELLQLRLIESIQWCDTRDMTADGHTKGTIDRALLLDLMRGKQTYLHEVKRHIPYREQKALTHREQVASKQTALEDSRADLGNMTARRPGTRKVRFT